MSYGEIQRLYPEEFAARQANKLYYRYPGMGGESYTGKYLEVNVALVYLYATNPCYLDVIHRLQSMIIELERMTQSCLIVTHRVVMRILLGYLLDWTQDEMVRFTICSKHGMHHSVLVVFLTLFVSSIATYGCTHSFVSKQSRISVYNSVRFSNQFAL
jgi:hypothetical protein